MRLGRITLVLAWVALTEGAAIPRDAVPAEKRASLERDVGGTELQFMRAHDHVRESATFRKLTSGDQRRIAAILFEVYPPTK